MKLAVLSIAAAMLATACASTAPQSQMATNMAACSSSRAAVAATPGANAIEATAHCSSAPSLTPDKLHQRASAEARTRHSQGRN